MGFREGVMFRFYFLRICTVGEVLFFFAPLFFILLALGYVKHEGTIREDLSGVWNSVYEAWQYGEI